VITLPAGRIKRVHVSQVAIRANRKDGGDRAVFTIQLSTGPVYARQVEFLGANVLRYEPEKPLSCGARVWIETRSALRYDPA